MPYLDEQGATVLVVGGEDGSGVDAAASLGEHDGLRVVLTDPAAVLDRLREDPDPACVVLYQRQAADDREAYDAVREAHPDLPIVVLSATDQATVAAHVAGDEMAEVVDTTGAAADSLLVHRVRGLVERRREHRDLLETQARFRTLAEQAPFGILTIDGESTVRFASEAVEAVFGYEPSELVGEPLTTVMPTDFQYVPRTDHEGDPDTPAWNWIELFGTHRDGHQVPIEVSYGETTVEGEPRVTVVVRDISEQKERQRRLQEQAQAIEASIDGIALMAADRTHEYVNDAYAGMFGHDDPADLEGEPVTDCYALAGEAVIDEEIMPTVRESGRWRGQLTGVRADGTEFPVEASVSGLGGGDVVAITRDVTERVERERDLREEQAFTDSVLDALSDVFYVLDTDGTFQRWNDRLREVTGYTDAELDGMYATEIIAEEDREMIFEAMQDIYSEGTTEVRTATLLTDGSERIPYEFNGTALTDAGGDIIGLVGTGRDITERQLRQQRLAVLSRVLRHNVRNQLSVVLGHTDVIRARADAASVGESVDAIETAAEDLVSLSDRAREVETALREGSATLETRDLREAIENAAVRVERETGVHVECTLPEHVRARANSYVGLAVEALVDNAATHAGTDPRVRVTAVEEPGRTTVTVEDDGPGVPETEQAAVGGSETQLDHASGLGLWLTNWVASSVGGSVEFGESDLGGAAVTLVLPTD